MFKGSGNGAIASVIDAIAAVTVKNGAHSEPSAVASLPALFT
nr:hypothetical protein [Bacillus sp. K2I17]